MYQPIQFREDRREAQHALIRANPLGLLVSIGAEGPIANAVPFLLDAEKGPNGKLRAHLARANSQYKSLREHPQVLVIFQGTDAYVTPSWYASKKEHGKVVPTWNYAMVQVRGTARVIDDEAWLERQIRDLTALQEASRKTPWQVDDAPPPFIAAQIRGIVGIELSISEISGKWKVSQNRPEADRRGVADGLDADSGNDGMARLVRDYGGLR
jgi:transcriptional regulator